MTELDDDRVVSVLNRILEMELAGVVRYTHYSFLRLRLWAHTHRFLASYAG